MQKDQCDPTHVGLQRQKRCVVQGRGSIGGKKLRRLPVKKMQQLRIMK
jgi:hypothetical protein